jgi:putative transposase
MSEAEVALIAPLLPPPKWRGRKPRDAQIILNGFLYSIRCGFPWRSLSKDFPPFTTVQNRFYAWRDSGLWALIISVLVIDAHEAESRHAAPMAVVGDSQSVKTRGADGPLGFDAGKKIKGRKRHLAVDTLGLPIECQITTAHVQDRGALAPLLKAVHGKSRWVTISFVDGGYQGDVAQRAVFEASHISITVVKRTDKQLKKLIVLPKRWVVRGPNDLNRYRNRRNIFLVGFPSKSRA